MGTKKTKNKYAFVFFTDGFPSLKLISDSAYNALLYFLHEYADMTNEDDFDADEGQTREEMVVKIRPNKKLAKMLEINTTELYRIIVMRDDKMKDISKDFWESRLNY